MTNRVKQIIQDLDTASAASVANALDTVKGLSELSIDERLSLARALTEVFFHAHHTGSTLMPKLAVRVEKRIAKFGPEMIPFLFDAVHGADSDSAVYFGKTLARNGQDGLAYILPKLAEYQDRSHDLINLIQVLSYFKIPSAAEAIPIILRLAQHQNHQVTAMSLHAVGRLTQLLPATSFDEALRCNMFDSAFRFLSYAQVLVRKNAAHCLGKMLRKGLLSDAQEKKLCKAFLAITGKDENHNWDRAFIVRREAEDYLPYFRQGYLSVKVYKQHNKILAKRFLCQGTYHFIIDVALIARKIEAGQFVIIRPHIYSERIPLSVCGWNREEGTIEVIISAVGKTTTEINAMEPGDSLQDIVGPLGERSLLPTAVGTCVVIGGGYGTGAIIPTAKDLKALGNKVIGIVGARNADSLIMVAALNQVCDEVAVTTNDGSQGLQGFVTDALQEILQREQVIHVLAIGPVPMMKAVSEMTRPATIPTYVSLNAVMVDGTGMCGACRVTVGGETKFACFHGPDFDGHKVDFDNLMKRQKMFVTEEKLALASMKN